MKKIIAFTLAETLVVIGIIGVVAALTLPNLNSSTGDKEKVAKVQKLYSNLNDAIGRAEVVYGSTCTWIVGLPDTPARSKRMGERISDFLKISKNCGFSSGCASDWLETDPAVYNMILADGTSVSILMWRAGGCDGLSFEEENYGSIYVDIDGPNKGKNTFGKDMFMFDVTPQGIYPRGGQQDKYNGSTDELLKNNCFAKKNDYCTGWVVENGNMDYLKADSNGKCPNGTQLSWTNTSCK